MFQLKHIPLLYQRFYHSIPLTIIPPSLFSKYSLFTGPHFYQSYHFASSHSIITHTFLCVFQRWPSQPTTYAIIHFASQHDLV